MLKRCIVLMLLSRHAFTHVDVGFHSLLEDLILFIKEFEEEK